MKIKTMMAICAGVAALTGCATATPYTLVNSFNAADVAWAKERGTNTVEGSALLRQQGGGVVTCAGFDAYLIPHSAYAEERITYIYKNSSGGYMPTYGNLFGAQLPRDAAYEANMIKTTCDAQGNFKFTNVPDGDYYAQTMVTWTVGYSSQGGNLAQRVSVEGGETKNIVLTNN